MYGNDYSISLLDVAAWLTVAAVGGAGIAFVRRTKLRTRRLKPAAAQVRVEAFAPENKAGTKAQADNLVSSRWLKL